MTNLKQKIWPSNVIKPGEPEPPKDSDIQSTIAHELISNETN